MGVKFFGQYLIERGEVTAEQVRAALNLMDAENRSIGELAVEGRLISEADADKVNAEQRHRDMPFGELAAEMGLLDEEQIDNLVQLQWRTRLRIGQALVRLKHLGKVRLEELLISYEEEQAPHRIENLALPTGLESNALAPFVLDLFANLLMRVARIATRMGNGELIAEPPDFPIQIAVSVNGESGLQICLMGDEEFSRQVAAKASGLDAESLDMEMLLDGVGEFLNVLAGNAMAHAEQNGITMELQPPQTEINFDSGFLFELAVNVGNAALFLKPL
jgi:CheY-specific phosphatase CheX